MIIAVTPNPAWDVTITVDGVEPGESHRIAPAKTRFGGKGVNVARVLSSQGYPVTLIVPCGQEEDAAKADLAGLNGSVDFIASPTPVRSSYALVDTASGQTSIFNERGESQPDDVWAALRKAVATAVDGALETGSEETVVLVVSGSVPPGTRPSLVADIAEEGLRRGAVVVVDTTGEQLQHAVSRGVHFVKPNEAELRETTGGNDVFAGARALQEAGARSVLVSLGERGLVLIPDDGDWDHGGGGDGACSGGGGGDGCRDGACSGGGLWRAALPEALRGNATGAGDACVAALASLLSEGIDDAAALLERAVAWSAAAVLMPRAGEISETWPELASRTRVHPIAPDTVIPLGSHTSDGHEHSDARDASDTRDKHSDTRDNRQAVAECHSSHQQTS